MSNAGRVLVVEDHETERRAVSQILKSEGFTVVGAESADKALGYIDENIDVVLSDLHMGDVSGLQLLQLWKKRRPETHFILLTGHSSVDSAVEAIKSGLFFHHLQIFFAGFLVIGIGVHMRGGGRELFQ